MAVGDLAIGQEMAESFAEAIRSEPAVKRLWFWAERDHVQPGHDYVEFWLLTDELDEEIRRRLYSAATSVYDRFPEVDGRLHTLPPGYFDPRDPTGAIRAEAIEVPLRPS